MSGHAVSFAGTHEVSESHFTIYIQYVLYVYIYICVCLCRIYICVCGCMIMYDIYIYDRICIRVCILQPINNHKRCYEVM